MGSGSGSVPLPSVSLSAGSPQETFFLGAVSKATPQFQVMCRSLETKVGKKDSSQWLQQTSWILF